MVRVAEPRLRCSEALERPSENPSGENVKERAGPLSETFERDGPLSDQR